MASLTRYCGPEPVWIRTRFIDIAIAVLSNQILTDCSFRLTDNWLNFRDRRKHFSPLTITPTAAYPNPNLTKLKYPYPYPKTKTFMKLETYSNFRGFFSTSCWVPAMVGLHTEYRKKKKKPLGQIASLEKENVRNYGRTAHGK